MLKVWWFEIKPLTLHPETKTQCQGNKKVEKMKTIDLELSNKILKSNVEAMEAKISELKSEIKDLKSDIDYFECQNKVLKINNENFESDIMDYKERVNYATQINNEEVKFIKSIINSLVKTNTLSSEHKTYLMYDDVTQKFMIGKSNDPHKKEIEPCSDRCSINLVAYCDYDIVSVLHSMFSEYRNRGDWFNLSTIQVDWIIDSLGMKITNRSKLNEFYM